MQTPHQDAHINMVNFILNLTPSTVKFEKKASNTLRSPCTSFNHLMSSQSVKWEDVDN